MSDRQVTNDHDPARADLVGRPLLPSARVALIHDWLDVYTGAEKVLEQIIYLFPRCELFTLVDILPTGQRGFLQGRPVHTTFIQRLPFARGHFRTYFPLMPVAIEQFDLSGYDLVISSSHAVAKGVLTAPDQLHLSYIHSPIRYAWDMQAAYLRENRLERGLPGLITRLILHYMRIWDQRTANGIDGLAANSRFVAGRILKAYRREARVIHPPVDLDRFQPVAAKEDYYLAASRMVPYKKMDLILEAFARMPDRKLVLVGEGPRLDRLRSVAPPNASFLGYQSAEQMAALLGAARAFVFAAREDFGILPVEAQASGTPVIAFGAGGARETVRGLDTDRPTGVFFDAQTPEALCQAVERFEQNRASISPADCRANAERFSIPRFRANFMQFVEDHVQSFWNRLE